MELNRCERNESDCNEPSQKLISDSQFILFIDIFSIVCSSLSLLGSLGNIVVIKTFRLMGIRDGVTLSFIFLAVSDLAYLLVMAAQAGALGLHAVERKNEFTVFYSVDPFGIYIFLVNYGILIYLVTVLVTTFLAIARCLCVAMPLKFKNWFRQKTSVLVFIFFCTVSVASYVPILSYMEMVKAYDVRVNATRYVLWISPKREGVKQAIWISRDVLVTFLTQLVVIACVIILAQSLRTASKFRQASAAYSLNRSVDRQVSVFTTTVSSKYEPGLSQDRANVKSANSTGSAKEKSNKLSSKDIYVVQQVVLISTVYIVCNTPKICIDVAAMFLPDFTLGKSYQNAYLTFICVMELFQLFNSSIGILVYYNYNSKFRQKFTLFHRHKV